MDYSLVDFNGKGDENGQLIAIEAGLDVPFDIKRVYYIYGTSKDAIRGRHAHKKLEQIIFCIAGSCDFHLDDGVEKATVHLSSPYQGLHLKNNIWREFTNFSADCIVVVLANMHYDESDYIRNYDDFLNEVKK